MKLTHTIVRSLPVIGVCIVLAACGSKTGDSQQVPGSPTTPTPPAGAATLTAPVPVSPVNGEQLSTLRPTLTLQNGTSTGQGAKTYEFQVSDRMDFSLSGSPAASFIVSVSQTGVAEGGDGRTAFTVDRELQPTTRMYWRARLVQGSATSSWSEAATFRTKLVGYSRAGELYDPLIHNESIGELVGPYTFVAGKGIRLTSQNSYVRYPLAAVMANGEFSVEVEGLHPNGPAHKLKIFSMSDTTGDTSDSDYQMSTMYRGIDGNPPNCIAFKAVFGNDTRIVEPDKSTREASVRSLNPAQTYFWRATWGSFFRLMVADGGVNGSPIYDLQLSARAGSSYRPSYAYLGSNQSEFRSDAGTFPGATYRHVWIGNRPRPATLGNALD